MENKDTPIHPLHPDMPHSLALDQRAGLTKREYFAAMAMQGIVANPTTPNAKEKGEEFINIIASTSIKIADELLNQLNQ